MPAIGIGIGIPFRYSTSAAALSGAATLADGESDALAIDFTDMSAFIVDTGTPANDFDGDPNALLTYASPSSKWIRLQSGLWAADTTLRTEYSSVGVALGVRIEDTRTTLAAKPRRLDNATYWTPTNVSTSAVQGVDGVAGSATRISATAANATIIGTSNTSASSARRLAPFVRRVAGTGNLEWTLDNGATWTAFAGITSSFTRMDVGATVANPRVGFRIVSSGDEFDIDFANGETGAFSTSPIDNPAATGTVTRAADLISIAATAFPYSGTAGTVYAEFTPFNTSVTNVLFTLGDGTLNNRMAAFSFSSSHLFVRTGGVTQADIDAGGFTSGVTSKYAAAYASNDFAAVIDGGAVGTDASGTVPTVTALYIGWNGASASQLNGHIKTLMYRPRRVINADMIVETT